MTRRATMNLVTFLLVVNLAKGFAFVDSQTSVSSTSPKTVHRTTPNFNTLSKQDEKLNPVQATNSQVEENGLIEVKEEDIPEGSVVYVLEEPEDAVVDGEIMKTANNIVFRPLFRYREKQEAQRRNYNNRLRRRYFVPRRSYRHTYFYPYYYYRY